MEWKREHNVGRLGTLKLIKDMRVGESVLPVKIFKFKFGQMFTLTHFLFRLLISYTDILQNL